MSMLIECCVVLFNNTLIPTFMAFSGHNIDYTRLTKVLIETGE